MKKLYFFGFVMVMVLSIIIVERHRLAFWLIGEGKPPVLLERADEGPGIEWQGDYFAVKVIDEQTYAIIEPLYQSQNINYLLLGDRAAILFDAGAGVGDALALAKTLTDLPITFLPSHLHYDHVGNNRKFDRIAMVDLPHLRARSTDNRLTLTWDEHVGTIEGYGLPTFQVDEWLTPNQSMNLDGRDLVLLYTPGHTYDSVSLLDETRGYLFTGDFLIDGTQYAFMPTSSMGDYQQGAANVLAAIESHDLGGIRVFGAHRPGAPGVPELGLEDIQLLQHVLNRIKSGALQSTGIFPVEYDESGLKILAEPAWLQNWKQKYPDISLTNDYSD